jgi:hypothetical protein
MMNYNEIEQSLQAGLDKLTNDEHRLATQLEEHRRLIQRQLGALQLLAELRKMGDETDAAIPRSSTPATDSNSRNGNTEGRITASANGETIEGLGQTI